MLAALRQSALSRAYCSGLIHKGLQGRPCLGLCRCSSSLDEPGPQDRSRRRRQQQARQETKTTKSSKSKGSKAQASGEDTAAAGLGQAAEQVSPAPAPAPAAAPPAAAAAPSEAAPPAPAPAPAADEGHAAEQLPLSHVLPLPEPGQPQYPDAPFQLREYQLEAISAIIRGWKEGNNAQLVMLPTGCGKTVVFAGEQGGHCVA